MQRDSGTSLTICSRYLVSKSGNIQKVDVVWIAIETVWLSAIISVLQMVLVILGYIGYKDYQLYITSLYIIYMHMYAVQHNNLKLITLTP